MQMTDAIRPLDDLRVLDLTHYYNGPYATMLLAYLGAEVIKIESPNSGDGARPLYRPSGKPFGIPFALMNSNKRAITLNLKASEGCGLFKRMIAKADMVVENFAAGTMDKLGLGYEVLREINPRLIYASGTGYGLTGPNRNLPAFDGIDWRDGRAAVQGRSSRRRYSGCGPSMRRDTRCDPSA
jgi:CoA:oxalate CoA-transferase